MSQYFAESNMGLSNFYDGKTIFLTGATGFLGSVLLEALLRCFPGIAKIYILVRPKKGVESEDRKKAIFKKKIMKNLLKTSPGIEDKVCVIRGDVTESSLGMSEEDMLTVINQATIVFHCGAVVKFLNSARYMALQNSQSTDHIVELCKKIKKLDVLVYTSTAYSFNNFAPKIEEIVYRLPFPAQRFLDELKYGTTESFDKLVASCKPDWINYYTFSKALAENILQDKAADLPVAIMRPAVIFCTWRNPIPGYIDNGSGCIKMISAYGRGLLKVFPCPESFKLDIIPADVVVNAHIAVAWMVATNRCSSPFVVNLSSFNTYPSKVLKVFRQVYYMVKKNMIPNTFMQPDKSLGVEGILFWIYVLYKCYAPSLVFDIILRFQGNKLRLFDVDKYLLEQTWLLYQFCAIDFEFEGKHFKELSEKLVHEGNEMLYMDLENLDIKSYIRSLVISADMYDWTTDKLSPAARKRQAIKNTMIYTFFKRCILFLFCYIVFSIVRKILF